MNNINYQTHASGFIEEQFLTCRPKNGLEFTIDDAINREVVFDLHRSGEGEFIDPKRSYFLFEFKVKKKSGTSANYGLRLERSAGSIICSYKIQSGFGVDLENVRDYSDGVEAMTCIMDQKLDYPTEDGKGYSDVFYYTNTSIDTLPTHQSDLGALLASNYAEGLFANGLMSFNNLDSSTSAISTKYIHQLRSSMFGCYSKKYLPLSLMKGLRITLTLEFLSRCMTTVWAITNNTSWTVSVIPTLKYYLIKVPSTVERRIFDKKRIPIHGIGMQTMFLDTSVNLSSRSFQWALPIKCKSLRAVFFGIKCQNTYGGYDNAGTSGTSYVPQAAYMCSAFAFGYLKNYQFFLDQRPVTDNVVDAYNPPFTEVKTNLKLALGINLSDRQSYSTIFDRPMMTQSTDHNSNEFAYYKNFLYGQMFPSIDMSTNERSLELRCESYYDFGQPVLIMWVYDQTLWIDTDSGECVLDR